MKRVGVLLLAGGLCACAAAAEGDAPEGWRRYVTPMLYERVRG